MANLYLDSTTVLNASDLGFAGGASQATGKGPGGGLGVFSNVDEFSAANQPELEDTSPGLLQKILGVVDLASKFIPSPAG